MTMPNERTRAMVWAGGFLIELARDNQLPLDIRRRAVVIARHFPTMEQISMMARFRHPSGLGIGLESPFEDPGWTAECRFGPLSDFSRLEWPSEDGVTS